MKTQSLLCLALVALLLPMASICLAADKVPDGWRRYGAINDYEVGVDSAVRADGKRSAYLKATSISPKNKVNLMQAFRAEDYRGKRVRLSAKVKVQGVASAAALWMRIDSESGTVSFDNMNDRAIRSPADWKRHEIVLDVPQESLNVSFGVMFDGGGQAWVDDFQFEVVGKEVSVTQISAKTPSAKKVEPAAQMKPQNLDFEN
jgi:hypothetical protein